MPPLLTQPIKFLGATVLSFNSSLGLGSQESTLSVDLIEDCEGGDAFEPNCGSIEVGQAVYFNAGDFNFNGVLTNWSVNQGNSGKVFSASVSDPRQLLENAVVVVDTYMGPPTEAINWFNVYAQMEGSVPEGNCGVFGTSGSGSGGMPYSKIISSLTAMSPVIYSSTGYPFYVDFSSFPIGTPDFYKIQGPSVTLLALLQDVCDTLALEFYVSLQEGNMITIGTISLANPPGSFSTIVDGYDGIATEISYGQELRNEKTKTVIFGENVHYLSGVNAFTYFFGEDTPGVPVVPYTSDACGFWIYKNIDAVNVALKKPLPARAYSIHELDIRCAMASYEVWSARAFMPDQPGGSLNKAITINWPEGKAVQDGFADVGAAVDKQQQPNRARIYNNKHTQVDDYRIIWEFLKTLGDTYYGKQFISQLNQTVCAKFPDALAPVAFTDIPTNEGGWVDDGASILGLNDDDGLGFFRNEDHRISCFAIFKSTDDVQGGTDNPGSPGSDGLEPGDSGYVPGGPPE